MIFNEVKSGIPHIEDIPPLEFIQLVGELTTCYEATEKVDGAQILFGLDDNGFYTSRETKGGKRIYNESDYGLEFSSTYKRSAHCLLEAALPKLKEAGFKTGDQVEAEVLYGELPNVVPYSEDTSYLIFLRTTLGTADINRLTEALNGVTISVKLECPATTDGRTIQIKEETNLWKFSRAPVLSISEDAIADIVEPVTDLLKYLETDSGLLSFSNFQIESLPLNRIPECVDPQVWKCIKDDIKACRTRIREEYRDKILGIKEILLDSMVRRQSSAFGPLLEDNGWIEGVVLRNKTSGKMVKLVDKRTFGTVREEAWTVRNSLTERAKSVDMVSGFMGKLLLDMAISLGHPELGTTQAKAYLRKVGNDNFTRTQVLSENVDFGSVSEYWVALLENREGELSNILDKYYREHNYSSAINKRNLEVFATIFERISDFKKSISVASSSNELITILVGKQLGEI